jgi:hypothetical protein
MPIVNWIDVSYGDEVAILPYINCPPAEVLGIQVVEDIGSAFIELSDRQKFTQLGGVSRDGNACIVPATEEHRAVLHKRAMQRAAASAYPSGFESRRRLNLRLP